MRQDRHFSGKNDLGDAIAVLEFFRALGFERLPLGRGWPEKMSTVPAAPRRRAPEAAPVMCDSAEAIHHEAAPEEKAGLLSALRAEIGDYTRCKLSMGRTNIVFGEGNPSAGMMFIGEGPGEDEDLQARPFVGKAGVLLTRLIEKMELQRKDVYIANIVKCRPPDNREPEPDEIAACKPFVERQVDIVRPSVIVTLGKVALQSLMNNTTLKITASRGKFLEYQGIPVMPTFHPAYLLRNPADKWKTWADAQKALERMHHGRS